MSAREEGTDLASERWKKKSNNGGWRVGSGGAGEAGVFFLKDCEKVEQVHSQRDNMANECV